MDLGFRGLGVWISGLGCGFRHLGADLGCGFGV